MLHKDSVKESRLVVTKEEEVGRGMDWESEVGDANYRVSLVLRHKRLCLCADGTKSLG